MCAYGKKTNVNEIIGVFLFESKLNACSSVYNDQVQYFAVNFAAEDNAMLFLGKIGMRCISLVPKIPV
jgi:hypothetical protein